jgi:MFS superfamily sulfate permease-like transporter
MRLGTGAPSLAWSCTASTVHCSFADAEVFGDDVTAAVTAADPPAGWVVLDMEGVTDIDSTATQMLVELLADRDSRGVAIAFARLKAPVAAYLDRAGIGGATGAGRVFLEADDAVAAYRARASADGPTGGTGVDRR